MDINDNPIQAIMFLLAVVGAVTVFRHIGEWWDKRHS